MVPITLRSFSTGANPFSYNKDGDGMRDGDEIHLASGLFSPLLWDSNGDGVSDHDVFYNFLASLTPAVSCLPFRVPVTQTKTGTESKIRSIYTRPIREITMPMVSMTPQTLLWVITTISCKAVSLRPSPRLRPRSSRCSASVP